MVLLLRVLLSLLTLQTVSSHPLAHQQDPEVPCYDPNQYTTSWFLSHTLSSFSTPFLNSALFYTRNMTTAAISYASSQDPPLTTIWHVWPCYLYNRDDVPSNPMRCIHNDPTNRTKFYEAMSRAFAMRARGEARVMHKDRDFEDPPRDGIWGRIELRTMKEGNGVSLVRKMDEQARRWGIAWRRIVAGVGQWAGWKGDLRKRDAGRSAPAGEYCMSLKEYAWFDNVEW